MVLWFDSRYVITLSTSIATVLRLDLTPERKHNSKKIKVTKQQELEEYLLLCFGCNSTGIEEVYSSSLIRDEHLDNVLAELLASEHRGRMIRVSLREGKREISGFYLPVC
ncbi:MAG: hypothetical protein LUO93_06410 [Methanomicrobiales archaeon]|nr:hypothetical protein [Methanomicrobiales archaeon]